MRNGFFKSYILQVFYSSVQLLGWSFVIFYFFVNGFTKLEIATYFTLIFLTAYTTTYFMKGINLRKAIVGSLFIRVVTFLILIKIAFRFQIYLTAIAFGIFIPLFWIPHKINFFGHSKKHNTATLSGLFNSIAPILRLVFPVIGGLIIQSFGYAALFFISAFLLLAVTTLASLQKSRRVHFDYSAAIRKTKGVRMLVFLEGIQNTITMILIPLITLSFIQRELSYGIFLSVISLFGVVASLMMTKRSDKVYERATYIYPTAILSSVFAILAVLSSSLLWWTLFVGLMTFTIRILSPFFETVVIDTRKSLIDSMHSREIFLSLGRAMGGGIVIVSLVLFQSLKLPIILISMVALAYPFLLSKKRIYKHSYTISDYFTDNSINISRVVLPQFFMLMPKSIKPKRNDRLHYEWRYVNKKIR